MDYKIPAGVRCLVYSFLKFETLLAKICKISSKERKMIVASDVLDQDRKLVILFKDGIELNGYSIAIDLATQITFRIKNYYESYYPILQKLME